jgi:hypothetical protein
LLFTVSLGKPWNHRPDDGTPTIADLATGYHSLRVSDQGDYVVFASAQLQPRYLIRFKGGPPLEPASTFTNTCDLCGAAVPTVWCVNDCAKLCTQCDLTSHKLNHIVAKHKRIPLSEARGFAEFCPVHGDAHVDFYCPKCHVPVCASCKMTGTHAKGEAASHPLISIRAAYDAAVETAGTDDGVPRSRLETVESKLEEVDAKLAAVTENGQDIESEIMRMATAAVDDVRNRRRDRVAVLESSREELIRKRAEIVAFREFIETQKSRVGPLAFIQARERYTRLAEELHTLGDLPDEGEIDADLSLRRTCELCTATRQGWSAASLGSPMKTRANASMSLRAFAREKKWQNFDFQPFQGSDILPSADDAMTLYLALPFQTPPRAHLLFSSARDGRSIRKLHEIIAGVGATAILVQAGEFVFGGFTAAQWRPDGNPSGEGATAFLFSVTRDAIIPYSPRTPDGYHLLATPDMLCFGRSDLFLSENFDRCGSAIENCYSVGLPAGGAEAATFLAGASIFKADIVEVWGFFKLK